MDLALARTFLEIAGSGSFVRAAERLHVTQTAVSARMRALEELLGQRLFVRNKSGATLTLKLVRTRDILKALGERKGRRILIGFALEVKDAVHQAMLKYKRKKLDYIVLNAPKSFAADRMDCDVYREGAVVKSFRGATKADVARWLAGLLRR